AGMSVREEDAPAAQLICDVEADGLVVRAFRQYGKYTDDIAVGQSCATARDQARDAGLAEKGASIAASPNKTVLLYFIASRQPAGGQVPFWDEGPDELANGPVKVFAGDGIDPFDFFWEIEGGTTSSVRPDGHDGTLRELVHTVQQDKIFSPAGELLCRAAASGGQSYQLLAADGEVLLTLWNHYLFVGAAAIPPVGSPDWSNQLEQVRYSFKADQLFAGVWPKGPVAATVTSANADPVKLEKANPMRKLEFGALLQGVCGSSGL
ncbi:MAG: hypothetical protein ACU83N_16440, partial [Gammaproteobacteria bacterium]